jgi:hypothetical protein
VEVILVGVAAHHLVAPPDVASSLIVSVVSAVALRFPISMYSFHIQQKWYRWVRREQMGISSDQSLPSFLFGTFIGMTLLQRADDMWVLFFPVSQLILLLHPMPLLL